MDPMSPSDRPAWWTRQYIQEYVLTEEEAWKIVADPPWKCVIAWVTHDCRPVVCEMAYAVIDGQILLTSTANRDKIKALRRNPAIAICFQGGGLKQVTVRGRVEFSQEASLVRRWAEATVDAGGRPQSPEEREQEVARYMSPDRVVLRVEIEKIRSFDGAKMFRAERRD